MVKLLLVMDLLDQELDFRSQKCFDRGFSWCASSGRNCDKIPSDKCDKCKACYRCECACGTLDCKPEIRMQAGKIVEIKLTVPSLQKNGGEY